MPPKGKEQVPMERGCVCVHLGNVPSCPHWEGEARATGRARATAGRVLRQVASWSPTACRCVWLVLHSVWFFKNQRISHANPDFWLLLKNHKEWPLEPVPTGAISRAARHCLPWTGPGLSLGHRPPLSNAAPSSLPAPTQSHCNTCLTFHQIL